VPPWWPPAPVRLAARTKDDSEYRSATSADESVTELIRCAHDR
jgi:hypothetical protein